MHIDARLIWRRHRAAVYAAGLLAALWSTSSIASAHHADHRLAEPSARCGWIDGPELRDRRNLERFCTRWVPADLRVSNASADRERLWIEAPADLASALRENDRTTAALLRGWLEHWRQTTGYTSASVVLVRRHIEFARIQTTMDGDVVVIR
jgi:hypothetical protein